MSKWLKKDAYEMFANNKSKEKESAGDDTNSFYKKWKNPVMGTVEKAKEYILRLLPDTKSNFYKKYFYHGFTSGEKFQYVLCEKTFGMDNYCPWCEATKILYQGNETDKKKAGDYKRRDRFVGNVFIKDDPRDADVKDEQYKVNGTIRLYEFPTTVESKISNEVTDTANGYGVDIFDPENGFDLILKVKAKPKDKSGKEWPDYGDTMFARKASSIEPDEEKMEKLMAQRIDLDEYILSMKKGVDVHEQLLKAEMLWDDVGASFNKKMKGGTATTTTETKKEDVPFVVDTPKVDTKSTVVEDNQDDDTDDLLNELADM